MTLTPTPRSAHEEHLQRVPEQREKGASGSPRTYDPDEVLARHLFDEGLVITVRAMRDLVEPQLEETYGARWTLRLQEHLGAPFSHDILSYRDALRFEGSLQPVIQSCFPLPYGRWEKQMRAACRARNKVAHPTDVVTLQLARRCTLALMQLAAGARLGCADEVSDVLHRIERALRGEPVIADPAVLAGLAAENARMAAQAAQKEAELSRTRQVAEEAKQEKANLLEQLLAAQERAPEQVQPLLDEQTVELLQAAVDALESAHAEIVRLQNALQTEEESRRKAEAAAHTARASTPAVVSVATPSRPTKAAAKPSRARNRADSVLPDPSDFPAGTEMTGIKAADGLRRRPHSWVACRGYYGKAYWKHSSNCQH